MRPHSRWELSRGLLILGAWLTSVPPAGAHRLDEYLQATLLSIDIERVDLEIDLTPGVAVASEVFARIDTNRDGEISSAEGEAYAPQMLRSVVLSVDGLPAPVTLIETLFPQFRDMSLGVGTIRLLETSMVPSPGAGHHQVLSGTRTSRGRASILSTRWSRRIPGFNSRISGAIRRSMG
jgi:hypothetical protein